MNNTYRMGIGLLAGLVLAAPAARAADVTVRAESFSATTQARVTVSNTGADALASGKSCPGGSTGATAAGALERATGGDWDGGSFSFGLTVDRIRATNLGAFPSPTYWNFDVNHVSQPVGVCDVQPQSGDQILFYEACASAATGCYTGNPLDLVAPATVTAGVPFTVTVRQYDDAMDPAPVSQAAGATVTGGAASTSTAADGTTQVTLADPGTVTLVATKGTQVRDEAQVVVAPAPVYGIPSGTVAPAATGDSTAPATTIKGIREGRVFKRGHGPRTLRASVTDDSALASVKLALTRKSGKRCSAFSVRKGRFVKAACGKHPLSAIGSAKTVSFLLPQRLARGRYVLDVLATDTAGNRETSARGTNRVVFRVK